MILRQSFRGFGGEFMEQAGVVLAVHYHDMAFMGLAEVFSNLNKVAKYTRICKDDILAYQARRYHIASTTEDSIW